MKKILATLSVLLTVTLLLGIGINENPGFSPNAGGTKTLFVDTFGNDSSAVRGRADLPWLHPEAAASNALAGDTIRIGPGVYAVSNWFKCPTNGSIIGAGRGATMLIDYFTNGVPTPCIACSDNGYVANLSITNFFFDGAGASGGGFPAACIGTHQNLSASGQMGYTNFTGENLILYGGSDTFYNRHTNNATGRFINCKMYGAWDIATFFNSGTFIFDFYNCDFVHVPVADHGAIAYDIEVGDSSSTTLIRNFFCTFYMSNGIPSKFSQLWFAKDGVSTQAVEFYFCTATNAAQAIGATIPNPHPMIKAAAKGNSSPMKFVGNNFDVTSIGTDDIDGTGPAQWGNVVTTNLIFGGDSASGYGPQFVRNSAGYVTLSTSLLVSNQYVLRSNTLASLPTLNKGDACLWSSNGILYSINSSPAGVLTTNKLAP